MKYGFLYIAIAIFISACTSQRLPESNPEYTVSPLLVLKSEDAVVRDYDATLDVLSKNEAVYKVQKAITVLNSEARHFGDILLYYNDFQDIAGFHGAIYDANGELVRSIGTNDGNDFSLSQQYTLYQDTRLRRYELYHNAYPYTIVYSYEVKLDGLLNLPTFFAQERNQHVDNASLSVSIPKNLELKYQAVNTNIKPAKSVVGQDSVLKWRFENIRPVASQPYGKSPAEKLPRILLAVRSFDMAGTQGSFSSWDSFGRWYYELGKNRQELPEEIRIEIKNIFSAAPNRKAGIKALYEYMQDKTRYVSVQLGIGGWQPFEAAFVEQKRYGDCKALTNYMQAILSYAGVSSYPVLINNGIAKPDIVTDFPSNQFNHVILWIPEADTVWLESTSQNIPFNYIGYSNSNRHGLAVTPDSSFLIKTPAYGSKTNRLVHDAEVKLNSKGSASMEIRSKYSGYYLDKVLGHIAGKSESERETWIHNQYDLNAFRIEDADFSGIDQRHREPVLRMKIENPRYATRTESRMFVPVNKLNRWEGNLPDLDHERTEEINLGYSFREQDRSLLLIPSGFEVEALPEPITLNSDFGTFRLSITRMEGNSIEIQRTLEVKNHKFPPERYDDIKEFFGQIIDYDKKNIVLVES